MKKITENYDVAVIGGGMSGICAAIASARGGASTLLVGNRPVLGGNASSEIRMHICGADRHAARMNARETGILEEIMLKNKARNPEFSYPVFDALLWECCTFEPNLKTHLNTHIDSVQLQNGEIFSVSGEQQTTETHFTFTAKIFIDATGDGTIGALAGAQFMYGREDKSSFDEPHGQPAADHCTMGNSIMFQAQDMGHPVKYTKPFWAYSYTEQQLRHREHTDISSGYWWIELGGNTEHTIDDAELLRDELLKTVYGLWDHIKNGGEHGAENYELTWVCMLPGKRESRRLLGDYVLREDDLIKSRRFEDAIAYGGWSMDCHIVDGFKTDGEQPTEYIHLNDVYQIPYRCIISKNIPNLMLAGRAISASHLAFASSRVMGTCAVIGQAAGTAAAMAVSHNEKPHDICGRIKQLQQQLLRDDCYIPFIKNEDEHDLALSARFYSENGTGAQLLNNGVARQVNDLENCFIGSVPCEVTVQLAKRSSVCELRLMFESNLSRELTISISEWVKSRQSKSLPEELVRSFSVLLMCGDTCVKQIDVTDNIQRFVTLKTGTPVECDKIKLQIHDTYGAKSAKIYEMRVY